MNRKYFFIKVIILLLSILIINHFITEIIITNNVNAESQPQSKIFKIKSMKEIKNVNDINKFIQTETDNKLNLKSIKKLFDDGDYYEIIDNTNKKAKLLMSDSEYFGFSENNLLWSVKVRNTITSEKKLKIYDESGKIILEKDKIYGDLFLSSNGFVTFHYDILDANVRDICFYASNGNLLKKISDFESTPNFCNICSMKDLFISLQDVGLRKISQNSESEKTLLVYDLNGDIKWKHTFNKNVRFLDGGISCLENYIIVICNLLSENSDEYSDRYKGYLYIWDIDGDLIIKDNIEPCSSYSFDYSLSKSQKKIAIVTNNSILSIYDLKNKNKTINWKYRAIALSTMKVDLPEKSGDISLLVGTRDLEFVLLDNKGEEIYRKIILTHDEVPNKKQVKIKASEDGKYFIIKYPGGIKIIREEE